MQYVHINIAHRQKTYNTLSAKLSNTFIWVFYPTSKALQRRDAKTVREDRRCKIYIKIYEINRNL